MTPGTATSAPPSWAGSTTAPLEEEDGLAGALWVTGGVPVRRADGRPLETRDRMTLCRCGHSAGKPLCDGTHRKIGFREEPNEEPNTEGKIP
jgi:CDGSH-type Zn-finger protein